MRNVTIEDVVDHGGRRVVICSASIQGLHREERVQATHTISIDARISGLVGLDLVEKQLACKVAEYALEAVVPRSHPEYHWLLQAATDALLKQAVRHTPKN